jgi:hypothetical protein
VQLIEAEFRSFLTDAPCRHDVSYAGRTVYGERLKKTSAQRPGPLKRI